MLNLINKLQTLFNVRIFDVDYTNGMLTRAVMVSWFLRAWFGAEFMVYLTVSTHGYTIKPGRATYAQLSLFGPKSTLRQWDWYLPQNTCPICKQMIQPQDRCTCEIPF